MKYKSMSKWLFVLLLAGVTLMLSRVWPTSIVFLPILLDTLLVIIVVYTCAKVTIQAAVSIQWTFKPFAKLVVILWFTLVAIMFLVGYVSIFLSIPEIWKYQQRLFAFLIVFYLSQTILLISIIGSQQGVPSPLAKLVAILWLSFLIGLIMLDYVVDLFPDTWRSDRFLAYLLVGGLSQYCLSFLFKKNERQEQILPL